MKNGRLTLSIESAVAGGSLALLRNLETIGVQADGNASSRAEKILTAIDDLLKEAGVGLRDLDAIAVSIGPGSYSGIRIGVSTALGLGDALGIECVGISVLEAMAAAHDNDKAFIVALPVGKNDVAWQRFSGDANANKPETEPQLIPSPAFIEILGQNAAIELFAHADLLDRLRIQLPASIRVKSAGAGMAEYIGRLAQFEKAQKRPVSPMYLRNSQAPKAAAF